MVVCNILANESIGSIFRRKDGKYFIYLPMDLVEDTGFPFPITETIKVKVSFKPGEKKIIIDGI